jgi:hypothetical protein
MGRRLGDCIERGTDHEQITQRRPDEEPSKTPGRDRRGRCERTDADFVLFSMMKFLLWCVLLVVSWPLALLALVLYPLVWLILIPFRLVGIAVEGGLGLVRGIVLLPGRLLGGFRSA